MQLADLLKELINKNGSDLHIVSGTRPVIRVNGVLSTIDNCDVLDSASIRSLFGPYLTERQFASVDARVDVHTSLVAETSVSEQYGEANRFRACIFWDRNGLAAALRVIPRRIPSLTDLFSPDIEPTFRGLTELRRGLVLTVGMTGSGKSTTTAAMIETINVERAERIFTIEDPIEYLHTGKKSLLSQREVGSDVESYEQGALSIMRADPDVVLVGEFRTPEALRIALALADTGHLVFATMQADTVSEAVRRLIETFPDNKESMRRMIARSLSAVIAQRLVRRNAEIGRAPLNEIMLVNSQVRRMIDQGESNFDLAIEAGRVEGMQTMDDSAIKLYQDGAITYETAWANVRDRDRLGPRPVE